MTWGIGLVANLVVTAAYLLGALAVAVPLVRAGRLRVDRLAAATVALLLTGAVHHAVVSVQLLLPAFDPDRTLGLATRDAWGWPLAVGDVVVAGAGLLYWSRRRSSPDDTGPAPARAESAGGIGEQQALELNDNVLQGLVVARMALDLGDVEKADRALGAAIDSASRIVTDLLGGDHPAAGMLRSAPAVTGVADVPDESGGDPGGSGREPGGGSGP
jgi:hypothetical protein